MRHETNTDQHFHTKEGQPRLSCRNEVGEGCPSLVSDMSESEALEYLAKLLVDEFYEQIKHEKLT